MAASIANVFLLQSWTARPTKLSRNWSAEFGTGVRGVLRPSRKVVRLVTVIIS